MFEQHNTRHLLRQQKTEITTTSRESQDTGTLFATITKNIIFVRPLSRVTALMTSVGYTGASATSLASL